ncbi:AMP-binding protein [Gaetbulibacter sp. M240]|uniref:AMP-binding protein n=1 Tax=Gaetbulibacter sp. M240 TaxID=3126511 RepID=UPI00374F4C2F
MTPNYTQVHNRFRLNGHYYSFDDLMEVAYSFVKEGEPYQEQIGNFLLDWLDNKDYIIAKTSGSTGRPKRLKIKKQAMVNSAIMTGDYFGLTPGDKVLNCLPSNFIAGKMMIVRAIALGLSLELVEPSAHPLIDYEKKYDFCAFTPMQLKFFLNYSKNLKTIIVGGAPVPKSLLEAIQNIPSKVYETFGMTETVSHIAMKKLNNFKKPKDLSNLHFKTLPEVSISQDDRGCLVIDAPKLLDKPIVTNDMITMYSNTEFDWLGRWDNVINTGGVKVFPEQIEHKLQKGINKRFFITSIPDDALGQKVILVVESEPYDIDSSVFESLDKFEKPKAHYFVPAFAETASHKIHRKKTLKKLQLQES